MFFEEPVPPDNLDALKAVKDKLLVANAATCPNFEILEIMYSDVAVGEDVADAVWYFAVHARNTTGAELVVDGGNTIQLYPIIPQL